MKRFKVSSDDVSFSGVWDKVPGYSARKGEDQM
jgi:hypothetical protein